MQKEQLADLATKFVAGFPAEITEDLDKVELLVVDTPEEATAELQQEFEDQEPVPADAKGLFAGDAMVVEDSDTTEEEEVVYPPEGYIVVIAQNIKNLDELCLVLMHEMGHALGMDEDEVKALGLGLEQVKGAMNGPPETDNPPVRDGA